jgi:DNA-binding transcriptional MerR regulator
MYRIGHFSRLTQVPVKTLRFYDELGLFKPDSVDEQNGYRYYRASQLPRLNRILVLKELGLSLEQIKRILEDNLSAQELRGMLKLRKAELDQQLQEARQQLGRVETQLQYIEQEGAVAGYEVILKSRAVEAQRVASIKREISEYDGDMSKHFGAMFETLYAHVFAHTQKVGPATTLYHDDDENKPVVIEACLPVLESIPSSHSVAVYDLPAVETTACLVHQGSFEKLGQAYQSLMVWLEQHAFEIAGPAREVYLHFDPQGNKDDTVTEIQLPIRHTQGRTL